MKRSTTDVLRRGFESLLANWPLLFIRIAESFILVALAIGTVIALIIPFVVSLGLNDFDFSDVNEASELIAGLLIDHWIPLVVAFVVISVALVLFIAIHSFVEAGSARIYLDADDAASRALGTAPTGPGTRQVFSAFRADRWLLGGKDGWWAVFWIYNMAWGVASLVLIIPILALLVLILVFRETTAAAVTIGCAGGALVFLLAVVTVIITNMWTLRAIVSAVAYDEGWSSALRRAWRAMWDDFGRQFAVTFIIFVVLFGGSMLIAMMSSGMSFGSRESAAWSVFFAPMQIASSLLNSMFSAAMAGWLLASYATLVRERGE